MINRKLIIILVLLLNGLVCLSQSTINFDSLRFVSENNKDEKIRADALNSWAYELRRLNPDSGLILAERANVISRKINYQTGIADYFTNKGTFLFGVNNDSVIYYFKKALSLYLTNDWLKISRVQSSLSNTFLILAEYDSALYYARLAMNTVLINPVPESEQKNFRLMWNYKGLGDVFNYIGMYDSSITYSLKSLNLAEKFGYTDAQSGTLIAIANVYSHQDDYTKAIHYTEKAAALYNEAGNYKSMVLALTNLGNYYCYLNLFDNAKLYTDSAMKLAEIYEVTRNYPRNYLNLGEIEKRQGRCREALPFFEKGLKLAEQDENYYVQTMLFGAIGETYNCLNKGKEAIPWLLKSLDAAEGDNENIMAAYHGLSIANELSGNFKNAFLYHKKYVQLKDSLYNINKAKVINELNSKYQVEKKTEQISWLQKENLLKAKVAESEKQKAQLAIIVIIVLIIASSYGFFNFRKQKKAEHQKALLDERLRISRELHDDMGSTLSSISVYSEVGRKRSAKNANTEEVLHKISFASRELIDKMSDIVWSLNPGNETASHLKDRMLSFAAIMLNPKEIGFEFDADDSLNSINLDQNQLKNLFLIYKEIIHNIIKYAECNYVVISIKMQKGKLQLRVADNGKGFDPLVMKNGMGGSGISNMKARALAIDAVLTINTENSAGTTVMMEMNI